MYPLKQIIVCLDLSPIDQTLMEYTAQLTKVLPGAKVYFIHVSRNLEIPDEIKKTFPGIIGPADEVLKKGISDSVEENFASNCDTPYEVEVKDGNSTEQIIRWSQVKEADLIVMGLKKTLKGSGTNASKITSICLASVLFVPESISFKLERVIVPSDFSDSSALALEQALAFKKSTHAEVLLQSVYKVPVGYHYTGKSYSEFAVIMRRNAEKEMNTFLKKLKLHEGEIKKVLNLDDDDKPADMILREAIVFRVDMIILGSKGRTMLASLLLGSVAASLINKNKDIPYLIVKDKKANMSFLEAFNSI